AGGGKDNAFSLQCRLQQHADWSADAEIGCGLSNAEAERRRLLLERQPHTDELQRQRLAIAEDSRRLAEVGQDMGIMRYRLDPKAPRVDDFEQNLPRVDNLAGDHVATGYDAADGRADLLMLGKRGEKLVALLTQRAQFAFGFDDFDGWDDLGMLAKKSKLVLLNRNACLQFGNLTLKAALVVCLDVMLKVG